ncbi:DUF1800 family protein [Rhodoblastus sp.]|uniref:DUF1800 domain-containing protein n=1 Tax=Rhodoblastus sp. TaxID=1962975 RepID=UPI0035B2C964
MPAKDEKAGFIALSRFGFGSRGDGDLAAASLDPRGFLRAEIEPPGAALLAGPGLPDSNAALQILFAQQDAEKAAREMKAALAQTASNPSQPAAAPQDAPQIIVLAPQAPANPPPNAAMTPPANPAPPKPPSPQQIIFRAEALARFRRAYEARAGLVERLVAFWSNHFALSMSKGGPTSITAGVFEREAIRPHVLGRFADMLLAAESHPAMLFYLDAQQSVGPDSPVGTKQNRGRNENLGREILELHTLGVNGGYSQADVIALSDMLTGWRFAGRDQKFGPPGAFIFQANVHEPGAQKLLGADYPPGAVDQAQAALLALARRPETARHLAFKLAKHFVADAPPPVLVERLAQVFLTTDGDLRAVTLALIDAPESFAAPPMKMRDPWEFVVASARLLGHAPDEPGPVISALDMLGQPLWRPPGPNGFPDDAAAWASPDGIRTRLDLASQWAIRLRDPPDPRELCDAALGAAASPETRQAVSRAETRPQGLALLLMAPEAQRR